MLTRQLEAGHAFKALAEPDVILPCIRAAQAGGRDHQPDRVWNRGRDPILIKNGGYLP